ncbi:putative conserved lipoprotein LppL [Gordonia crocea]|uniref:Putative conserved lipoprotein LppL n=1 Tax=Gordonia crocea TaxID=589162 RepID=A0A7I9UZ67_9ACTN|nr:putative conserved lipoprotein LppL [Gordonia crocea]
MRPHALVVLAATAVLTVGVAGCGSGDEHGRPDVPTVAPQTPLSAPPVAEPPAGAVVEAPRLGSAIALTTTARSLAAIARDGRSVSLFSPADPSRPALVAATPEVRAITADGDGFVAVGPASVARIAADGTTTVRPLARPGLSVAVDGPQVFVGTEHGHLLILDAALTQTRDIGGFVRVDEVAVGRFEGRRQIVVLDRAQSLVTTVDPNGGERGAALRAGNGATTLIADRFGRFLVANPRDGQLLGFYGNPLIMRFRFPVADGPYGLAYDSRRNLLWVSLTAANRVVGYDLSAGEPRERARFATVRQPDSIAVDPASGVVFVLSATGGGLQRVQP